MTLYEIIEKAKTKKHTEFDIWTMAEIFELDSCSLENVPINSLITQCYFIEWLCADTRVGASVLFFDNEPVAITYKQSRKCELNIKWFSDECYYKVYNYVKSFVKEKRVFDVLSEFDKQDDQGENYIVCFTEQLLPKNKKLTYCDEEVEYVRDGNQKDCVDKTVVIRLKNGSEKLINISELRIAFFNKE